MTNLLTVIGFLVLGVIFGFFWFLIFKGIGSWSTDTAALVAGVFGGQSAFYSFAALSKAWGRNG